MAHPIEKTDIIRIPAEPLSTQKEKILQILSNLLGKLTRTEGLLVHEGISLTGPILLEYSKKTAEWAIRIRWRKENP